MATQTTYSKACASFAQLCNKVTADRDVVIINRRGNEDVALVAAAELSGLLETAHLLRSSKNAERLLTALRRARTRSLRAKTVDKLRQEMGLGKKD